jgi:hypothetical protein
VTAGSTAFREFVLTLAYPPLLLMELRPIRKYAATHVVECSAQLTLELFARVCHLSDHPEGRIVDFVRALAYSFRAWSLRASSTVWSTAAIRSLRPLLLLPSKKRPLTIHSITARYPPAGN